MSNNHEKSHGPQDNSAGIAATSPRCLRRLLKWCSSSWLDVTVHDAFAVDVCDISLLLEDGHCRLCLGESLNDIGARRCARDEGKWINKSRP